MKSQVELMISVVEDIRDEWCLTIMSKDIEFIRNRFASEGYPFLASWLPQLDDVLLGGLSSGSLPDYPSGLGRKSSSDARPKFLWGLWSAVFHSSGELLPNPCVDSIRAIRQISRLFKKVFEVCSDDKVKAAYATFKSTDESLKDLSINCDLLSRVNAILHGRMLWEVASSEVFPFKHGPGAVAERLDSVARWDFPSVSPTQAARFDMSDFFVKYEEDWPCAVRPQKGRVVAVPKTFDKPRLISIEPASAMYTQQGVLRELDRRMSAIPQINMRDQSRNRELARSGSRNGVLATIDLSEASDRVSLTLVSEIFKRSDSFLKLINDVRTPAVDVDGEDFPLRKFASMGCALTFPVQMLVFRTIIITAIVEQDGNASERYIRYWADSPDIGVFGDDIIVPTRYVQSVIRKLHECGLKVNTQKSFTEGLFRESCGGDYYAGVPVNPVYVRKQPPVSRHDVSSLESWAAMSHLLGEACLPSASAYASKAVEDLVGPCPAADGALSVARTSFPVRRRFNKRLQRHEVLARITKPRKLLVNASEGAVLAQALHKVEGSIEITLDLHGLVYRAGEASPDYDRLTHHGRPTSAFISRRWAPEY